MAPAEFTCEQCGVVFQGRRGRREYGPYWFCSRACWYVWRRAQPAGKWTTYSRSKRLFDLTGLACERCGVPAQVRHHRDEHPTNNAPDNVAFLCRACHARHHLLTTHCERGHEWTPENTYVHPKTGKRQCRACRRMRRRGLV